MYGLGGADKEVGGGNKIQSPNELKTLKYHLSFPERDELKHCKIICCKLTIYIILVAIGIVYFGSTIL